MNQPWNGYRWVPHPSNWDRTHHKYPCPETDHIDSSLNEMSACTIRLTPEEIAYCQKVGKMRNDASRVMRNFKISTRSDLFINTIGVCGECAICRYLGWQFKATINTFRQVDLPHNIEVRTRTESRYDLKVRPYDGDDRRCVMVLGDRPDGRFLIMGWITGKVGKTFETINPRAWEENAKPFHAVPQEALWPMSELKRIILQESVDSKVKEA